MKALSLPRWFALSCLATLPLLPLRAAMDPMPNIVYILADDLGIGDVGCYNPESRIPTPHMDRLAREGMRFTDAHTPSAVCTPTRYGILTGRYCWRTRLKYRVLDGFDPPLIEPDRVTVPAFLRSAGYRTGCIGKWHLGMTWTDLQGQPMPAVPIDRKTRPRTGEEVDYTQAIQGGPTAVGFDSYFGISASLNMSPFCFIRDDRPVHLPTLKQERIATDHVSVDEGFRSPDFTIQAVLPRLAGETLAFLQDQDPMKPFFLYLPLTSPHLPLAPNAEYLGKSQAGPYGDFVVETDAFVGVVLQALDKLQLANNTLVILTSDNGGLYHWWEPREKDDVDQHRTSKRGEEMKGFGHQGNLKYRGTKADIWEGGHRVPLLVRWPGHTPTGQVSDVLLELTDLLATCAAITGRPLPPGAGPDSRNMLPALLHPNPDTPVREFAVHHSLWGVFALREGPWKVTAHRGSGGFSSPRELLSEKVGGPVGQLYQLDMDPLETQNLWDKEPERVDRMLKRLQAIQNLEPLQP